VATVKLVTGDPGDVKGGAVLDARASAYGLGVAMGPHPQLGERASYIVIVFGRPR
jgi:hypothetical protein